METLKSILISHIAHNTKLRSQQSTLSAEVWCRTAGSSPCSHHNPKVCPQKNCRFTARIQSQMLFRRCEVDDIPSFPICWHAPRNFLLCFRQSRAKDLTHLVQIRSGIFILFFNVLIDGFDLTAVMVLAFAAETPTAFGAFLHSSEPPCA